MPPSPSEPSSMPRPRKRISTGTLRRRATIAATTPSRSTPPTRKRRSSTAAEVATAMPGSWRIARGPDDGAPRYDRLVRLPVVLFDLDGTVIDSGGIILASMRHAARTVLGRDVPDELVTVYREHNEPLHDTLVCCPGMDDVLERLREEGRRLGIVTAKRRVTVELAFEHVPFGHLFDIVVGGDETERHKPDPEPIQLALERLGARPDEAAYVGDSPFDIAAGKAAGVFTVAATWGGIHARVRLQPEEPDAIVDTPEELLAALA